MSVLNEVLGTTATPHTLECKGKTYEARLINDVFMAEFEKRFFQDAKDLLAMTKDILSPQEFRESLKVLGDEYLNGDFSLLSLKGQTHLKTTKGSHLLLSLIFKVPVSEVITIFSVKKAEAEALLQIILKESFPDIKFPTPGEGEGNPNYQRETKV